LAVAALVYGAARNLSEHMQARGVPMGFGFWDQTAGFDINVSLIDYNSLSTYGRAFWVGLLNTAMVGVLGIIFATPLGFLVGIARLSPNWLLARMAFVYVEIMRNTPLLLQLLFWYNAVLKALPGPRLSYRLGDLVYLNGRGLYVPQLIAEPGLWAFVAAVVLAITATVFLLRRARTQRMATGEGGSVVLPALAIFIVLPLLAILAFGAPGTFDFPTLVGFNIKGGLPIRSEEVALVFGLVVYTAGFIAEIVRAGVQATARGQTEAAAALGLPRGLALRLVVVPQAMRLIIPPLASQWLNIVKNSSLAVFIGFPDLVQIFAGTVLNQTQAAIQVMAITMGVYLAISLALAALLNLFNARFALRER
jgi:general L-amino acid transport system permease protein